MDTRTCYDNLVSAIAALNLPVVNDVRNLRPPAVLVEPPTITQVQSGYLFTLEFPVIVVAPPPANRDTFTLLLDRVDTLAANLTVTSAQPGTYSTGQQELPCYTVTITQQIRRT